MLDLNILLEGRDIRDIIIVSNSCGRCLYHIYNGVPVKEYKGNKNDISLVSLTNYLKSFKEVHDVRQKIKDDFQL